MSQDGRIVTFESLSTNLIPTLFTFYSDIYYVDTTTGVIDIASVDSNELHGGSPGSTDAAVSGDGNSIAFRSGGNNLVAGDTNNTFDIFVRNIAAGTTERVNLSVTGLELNGPSSHPALSFDGRFVAFETRATNVDPSDTSNEPDIYVRDRLLSTTTRVSTDGLGNGHGDDCCISSDGRFVAFTSNVPFLPADTNGVQDVYVRDMTLGMLSLVSSTPAGVVGNSDSVMPSISGDGSKVSFSSRAPNLYPGVDGSIYQVLVKNLTTGSIALASQSTSGQLCSADAYQSAISADGNHVTFRTSGSNLAPNDLPSNRDVFVRDLALGQTIPVSVNSGGVLSDNHCDAPCISADGQVVAYDSVSTNLIPEDTLGIRDVFVAYRVSQPTHRSFCYSGNSIFCPCSNGGLRGRGCNHSASSQGALLRATGTPSIAADSVLLESINMVPGTSALLFQGTARHNAGQGSTLGDGLLCASGTITRMAVRFANPQGFVQLGFGVAGDVPISVLGTIAPAGGIRTYQAWYRDAVVYCTPAFQNLTNGIEIAWSP